MGWAITAHACDVGESREAARETKLLPMVQIHDAKIGDYASLNQVKMVPVCGHNAQSKNPDACIDVIPIGPKPRLGDGHIVDGEGAVW